MHKLMLAGALAGAAMACTRAQPAAKAPRAGHYLYVADAASGALNAYQLNQATGLLSTISDRAPFDDRGGAAIAAIHPSGRFIYAAAGGQVELHAINTDGTISKPVVSNYGVSAGALGIDTQGRQLFAFNTDRKSFSVFDVDAASGRLTEASGSPVTLDEDAVAARLHPNGLLFFALTPGDANSRMHVWVRTSETVAQVVGSPFRLAADAVSFAISPDGRYAFVAHKSRVVAVYAIDDAGGMHPIEGSPFNVPDVPKALELDPGGAFLYLAYARGSLDVFAVSHEGSLTRTGNSSARAGQVPRLIAFALPDEIVDVASLPSPDSPSLLPIDTATASPRPPVTAQQPAQSTPSAVAVREPPKPPALRETSVAPDTPALKGLRLMCSAPQSVTNLERIPLDVRMLGPQKVRSPMLSVKTEGRQEGDTVEIEIAPSDGPEPRKPLPIKISGIFKPEQTDLTLDQTLLPLLVQITQPEKYVDKAVEDYINSVLFSRGTADDRDPVVRSLKNNRWSARETLKTLFMEQPVGTYDIYCTFHLKAAPLEKGLVAKSRVTITYRGRFFDQPTSFLH
jgi:6-phosphogluconolactonase (cycloisomerase 2 family)